MQVLKIGTEVSEKRVASFFQLESAK
jgi:hypothetical protein